jgi:phospholipid N-methyltransferase
MKKRLNFLKEYFKDPKKTGSITPSSKYLTKKMLNSINFSKELIILEFGAGNGVFSESIINQKNKNTKLIIIEFNKKFCEELIIKFGNIDNVFIINDDVLNLENILKELNIDKVDNIISSLPFLSLGEEFTEKLMNLIKLYLKDEFVLFQYTNIIFKNLKKHFPNIKKEFVFKNIPPAIIFRAKQNF